MRILLVWTTDHVTEDDLRAFAEGEGGYWNEIVGGEAVIERGGGRIFVAVDTNADDALEDDFEYPTKQLGKKPVSVVYVKIGHGHGSVSLAEDVVANAVRRWGGFVDRDDVSPASKS